MTEDASNNVGPQRAAPRSPRQLVAALKQFVEDLREAEHKADVQRHGVCKACNTVATHKFQPLPYVQTVYVPCDCGDSLIAIRYFPDMQDFAG